MHHFIYRDYDERRVQLIPTIIFECDAADFKQADGLFNSKFSYAKLV